MQLACKHFLFVILGGLWPPGPARSRLDIERPVACYTLSGTISFWREAAKARYDESCARSWINTAGLKVFLPWTGSRQGPVQPPKLVPAKQRVEASTTGRYLPARDERQLHSVCGPLHWVERRNIVFGLRIGYQGHVLVRDPLLAVSHLT